MRAILFVLPLLGACFSMYREAHEQHVQRMCSDPNYAYESGYNAGLDRRRLDTTWAMSCAPPIQAQVRQSYQTGYQAGIEHAPVVVRGSAGYAAPVSASCRFSSDCGDGQSCRPDASGA